MLSKHQSISAITVIAWTVIWLVAMVVLAYFWTRLPGYVAWPLSILGLILMPDISVLKKLVSDFVNGTNRR